MTPRLVVLLLVAATGCGERVAPLSRADSQLVLQHGSMPFEAAAWRQGGVSERGAMLASLFRDHLPEPTRNTEVFAALGPADCYVAYEDEPCYSVQLGQQRYRLEFSVNHSRRPGEVMAVRLRPAVTAAHDVESSAPQRGVAADRGFRHQGVPSGERRTAAPPMSHRSARVPAAELER